MTNYQVAASRCIQCDELIDAATPLDGGRGPEPMDVALCAYCGRLQAYGDGLQMRELTLPEAIACAYDPEIQMAQEMRKEFMAGLK